MIKEEPNISKSRQEREGRVDLKDGLDYLLSGVYECFSGIMKCGMEVPYDSQQISCLVNKLKEKIDIFSSRHLKNNGFSSLGLNGTFELRHFTISEGISRDLDPELRSKIDYFEDASLNCQVRENPLVTNHRDHVNLNEGRKMILGAAITNPLPR